MDLLRALDVLVRVVEVGSFSAVARERRMSSAAVTRLVGQLEDHFGVRLFHRTTRKLSLTDDGEMLLSRARPLLDGAEELKSELDGHRSSPSGLVRVGVTATGSGFLSPRLPSLLADHPKLRVELVIGDRFNDMVNSRLDLAVHVGEVKDASLVVRKMGNSAARVAVAAPGYIKKHGKPAKPQDLVKHACFILDVGSEPNLWRFTGPAGAPVEVQVSGGFLSNDSRSVHLAARSGYGIAFLSLIEVFDDIRAGHLVRLLNDYPAHGIPLNLVYPSRRLLAPRTRLVMDFIAEQIRAAVRAVEGVVEK